MGSWFHGNRNVLKKTQYYVWFLGSKESDGLRGREYVMPIMRDLLKDCMKRLPNKVTVQISEKGLKLVQTIPTMNKYGKVKTETMKFYIPAHSITYSMIGPPPYNDVVATLLLVFNPETKCPIHIHCYRCDSPDTAMIMHSNLQILINRPENQRRILYLEHRLMEGGLLLPPPPPPARQSDSANYEENSDYAGITSSSDNSVQEEIETESIRLARLHQAVFRELKEKLRAEPPILLPPKDYRNTFRKLADWKPTPEQNRAPPNRPLIFPKNNPRENNFFWKKPDLHQQQDGNKIYYEPPPSQQRKLSNSVTALDEGVLSSSTSGLGSDLSSSGGRFRYSIADISAQRFYPPAASFNEDRDVSETAMKITAKKMPTRRNLTTLDPHPTGLAKTARCFSSENIVGPFFEEFQETEKSGSKNLNFRLFGDTFRFTKRTEDVVQPNLQYVKYKKRSNNEYSAPTKAPKNKLFHRSVDNLHFVSENPEPFIEMQQPGKINWIGKRHNNNHYNNYNNGYKNSKDDGFWKQRAKQASWQHHNPIICQTKKY